jgi:hypothetical protein
MTGTWVPENLEERKVYREYIAEKYSGVLRS